jgi:maltose O-acetyltransferase
MMTRTEKDKMLAGELYNADAPELQAEMAITYAWLARYNAAPGALASDLRELLLERLATVGEGAMIRPPFHCDYGFNISLGSNVFLNFNCVILPIFLNSRSTMKSMSLGAWVDTGRTRIGK